MSFWNFYLLMWNLQKWASGCYNPKGPLTSTENSTVNELTRPTHHFHNDFHNLELGKWKKDSRDLPLPYSSAKLINLWVVYLQILQSSTFLKHFEKTDLQQMLRIRNKSQTNVQTHSVLTETTKSSENYPYQVVYAFSTNCQVSNYLGMYLRICLLIHEVALCSYNVEM